MSSQTDVELVNYAIKAVKTLKRYDPENLHFFSWHKKFLNVVKNLNVPDSKKVSFFCLMLESRIYTALRKHVLPHHPTRLSYEVLVKNLKTCPVMINQKTNRKMFRAREQHDDETTEKYAKNLECLYEKCQYKCETDGVLVDQFLYGLRNREIAKYLKKAKILIYKLAVERALLLEKQGLASTSKD